MNTRSRPLIFAFIAALLAIATSAAAAPTLSWDAVTTATDGTPLGAGMDVKTYNVYRCAPNVSLCTKTAGTKIGSATAPSTSFDLVGQVFPSNFVVTAVNVVGESGESVTIKATPADVPKNPRVGP